MFPFFILSGDSRISNALKAHEISHGEESGCYADKRARARRALVLNAYKRESRISNALKAHEISHGEVKIC